MQLYPEVPIKLARQSPPSSCPAPAPRQDTPTHHRTAPLLQPRPLPPPAPATLGQKATLTRTDPEATHSLSTPNVPSTRHTCVSRRRRPSPSASHLAAAAAAASALGRSPPWSARHTLAPALRLLPTRLSPSPPSAASPSPSPSQSRPGPSPDSASALSLVCPPAFSTQSCARAHSTSPRIPPFSPALRMDAISPPGSPPAVTQDAGQIDNAIRAIQQKRPIPEIDFTIHTMEDGSQVNTMERICKGESSLP